MSDKNIHQPKTFTAQVVQFLRPNGRRKHTGTELPEEVHIEYNSMLQSNCRLEAEVLSNNLVSITISNGEEDVDISLTKNGPEVQQGMVAMLKRKMWLKPEPPSDQSQ